MKHLLTKIMFAGLIPLVLMVTVLAACSSEVPDQPPAQITETSTERPAGAADSPTVLPATHTPASPLAISDQETPTADPELSGFFYYIGVDVGELKVISMDLATGLETAILTPPEDAWLSELALSPDGSQLLLAYSPPPEDGLVQYGYTDLYLMPADGSVGPELLLSGADSSESYFNISWPVAETIYYAHFAPSFADDGLITYGSQVERLHLPEATVETLAPGAAWPRVSNDGAMLAYVTDANELILAESSGANPKRLLEPETFLAIDAPLFSPDNSLLCFSAVEQVSSSLPFLFSRLLGLKIAYAHNVPSDWYCLPLDGSGEPVRLTDLDGLGLYGDFSAGGRYLAFVTTAGIYVVQLDGSDLRQLLERDLVGTLNWTP
jgi:hypothetical protein